jgi:hypothetical protein
MPRKKKPGQKSSGMNASDFVRSMPNASASDVVAAGKAKGLKFSAGLVYNVRSTAKNKAKPKGKPGRPKGSKNKPKAISSKPGRPPKAKGSADLAAFHTFSEAVIAVGGSQAAQRFLAALEALGI